MIFKIALRNSVRHLRQSILLGISIALGFSGVLLLGGYMLRMERYLVTQGVYLNHTGHISIYNKNGLAKHLVNPSQFGLNVSQQEKLRQLVHSIPELEFSSFFIHGQALLTNGCQSFPVLLWASPVETEKRIREHPEVNQRIPLLVKLIKGNGFWSGDSQSIVITQKLAKLLKKPLIENEPLENLKLRDQIITRCDTEEATSNISAHSGLQLIGNTFDRGLAAADLLVSGHYSTGLAFSEDSSALVSLDAAQRFFNTDQVTSMALFLKNTSDTSHVFRRLKNEADLMGFEIYRYDDPAVNPFYVGAMRFVYVMNLFFLILVCGVTVLSLLNSSQITIQERKNELGSILALGFERRFIVTLLSVENAMISGVSLVVGLFLALIIARVVNSLKIQFDIVGNAEKLILRLEPEFWFCAVLFCFFMAFNFIVTALIVNQKLNVRLTTLFEKKNG